MNHLEFSDSDSDSDSEYENNFLDFWWDKLVQKNKRISVSENQGRIIMRTHDEEHTLVHVPHCNLWHVHSSTRNIWNEKVETNTMYKLFQNTSWIELKSF